MGVAQEKKILRKAAAAPSFSLTLFSIASLRPFDGAQDMFCVRLSVLWGGG